MLSVTRLLDRAYDAAFAAMARLTGVELMGAADRQRWAACRTRAEVGEMVAQWLLGEIKSQPGYSGPVDVDEDDAPGLTAALVAANRAGFVTNASQAGYDGPGYDGAHWAQYAAVVGFADADTVAWLTDEVAGAPGLVITYCRPFTWRRLALCRQSEWSRWPVGNDPVTFREGVPTCDFGNAVSAADLDDDWTGYGVCHPDAVAEMTAAHQVVVRDADFGRNDRLWPALLAAAVKRPSGAHPGSEPR